MMKSLVLSVIALWSVPPLTALPSWRYKLPNGDRVSCPDGASGCTKGAPELGQPENACFGLGHATCRGGSLPLNPFGKDFAESGFLWTQELCRKDSDGDGVTNGQELGDPCCEWKEHDAPSPYMQSFVPTHPGDAGHKQASDFQTPECGTVQTVPVARGGATAAFAPGEEQRVMEWRVKDYRLPEERTNYADVYFNFDDDTHEIFHIVFGEAIVALPKNLHHFIVTGCATRVPEELVGVVVTGDDAKKMPQCTEGFGGWAPGAFLWDVPTTAGVPVGAEVGIVAVKVQIHYTDGDIHPGISTDGIRVHYTPNLRPTKVVTTSMIRIGLHPTISIPPGKERYFVTRRCVVQASRPLQIVASNFHAHLLGTEMYQTLVRKSDGVRSNLKSQPIWHFDDQRLLHFGGGTQRLLHPGDVLEATCVFNSFGRSKATKMGIETVDEMCFNQLSTLHNTSDEGSLAGFKCKGGGNLWVGEMETDESGFELQDLHPESKADSVWQMKGRGTVGKHLTIPTGSVLCVDDDATIKEVSKNRATPYETCSQIPVAACKIPAYSVLKDICCASCSTGEGKITSPPALSTPPPSLSPIASLDLGSTSTGTPTQQLGPKLDIVWTKFFDPSVSKNTATEPGETLVFSWSGNHNVFEFPDRAAYDSCDFSAAKLLGATSPVMITLDPNVANGTEHFYGCQVDAHCDSGQKMTVTIGRAKSTSSPATDSVSVASKSNKSSLRALFFVCAALSPFI